MLENKVGFIYCKDLLEHCNKLPPVLNRASLVQELINSYNLLTQGKIIAVQSVKATENELRSFHSSDYIEFLKSINSPDTEFSLDETPSQKHLEFGIGYDCPAIENVYDFVQHIAGSSVSAAKILAFKKCETVINWFGGWHHAQRDMAEGFCYVNDVVIAIQILCKVFQKVLYIDLDVHHGNGVENAFQYSNRILTLSFHRYGPGFFPNTGSVDDIGYSKGKYYSLNVPFKEGINDENYVETFKQVFSMVFNAFQPQAIVVQCGADGLIGDKIGECNLTLEGVGECVKTILKFNVAKLFLGGGGYNFPNTARLWTYLTSIISGQEICNDIPDTCENFTNYGPTFELHITKGLQKDNNTKEYLKGIVDKIRLYCNFIS